MAVIDAYASTDKLDELLKKLYAPWEIEQLVNLTYPVLMECVPKGSAALGGDGFFFPVRVESAEGHAYIDETQLLPTPQHSVVRQARIRPTVFTGVIEISGLAMAVSQGNAAAFARGFDENIQQTILAMSAYKEGVLFRDGTGQLCTFVTNPDGVLKTFTMSDVGFLRIGMRIDVLDSDLTDHHNDGLKITDLDWVAKTMTTDLTVHADAAAADFVYIAGSQLDTVLATSKEPLGFDKSMLDTGTYLEINRATYPLWQSQTFSGAGFLDETILLKARTRVTQQSGLDLGQMATRFKGVCHPMQVDTLFKLAIPRIRYSGNEKFDLGNSQNLAFGNIDFVTSYQCPPGTLYLGDYQYSNAFYTPGGELHIDSEYNGSTLKWRIDKDVGIAFAKEYCAFALRRPNAFIRVTGLTEQTR